MGIDSQSDTESSLQIGPTSEGMVRIYVTGDGVDLPMDFEPEDAEEIAEELMAAAARARGPETKQDRKGPAGKTARRAGGKGAGAAGDKTAGVPGAKNARTSGAVAAAPARGTDAGHGGGGGARRSGGRNQRQTGAGRARRVRGEET